MLFLIPFTVFIHVTAALSLALSTTRAPTVVVPVVISLPWGITKYSRSTSPAKIHWKAHPLRYKGGAYLNIFRYSMESGL
jgi:hypothetical protein